MINIIINNNEYQVRANASVLQACEEVGIEIPRFCYHEKLSVAGNCRMCLVEVQKAPKPVVSCAMPVSKGMVIFTDTPLVKKAREGVLEFLLINHPLDCPICDQGGECDLQDETLNFASDRGRFFEFKRSVEDKECGPIIKTIMTRCIHCTRCVRFTTEVVGQEVLGAFGRGQETEIGTYIQSFIKTELSGNLVDLCPVGALTSKPYAFKARNWELQKIETIDFFDSLCSDIIVQTRKGTSLSYNQGQSQISTQEEILRVLPCLNGIYLDNWISDRTRFAFDGLKNQRLVNVLFSDRNGLTKGTDLKKIIMLILQRLEPNLYNLYSNEKMESSLRVGAVVGSMIDIEGLYFLSTFIKLHGGNDIQYNNYNLKMNIDAPFFFSFNRILLSLENIGSLMMIGVNTRFETSLVNTILRKIQNLRGLSYASLGSYSLLRLKQDHIGNGLRALWALTENRNSYLKKNIKIENISLFFGIESMKMKGSFLVQNLIYFLAQKFYVKNKKEERLSFVHANISTLSFAHLGIVAGVRSPLYVQEKKDKNIGTLFSVQLSEFNKKKWISSENYTHVFSFSTHKDIKKKADVYIPLKSFYEKSGFIFNLEGRLRRFSKSLTSPKEAISLELFFASLGKLNFEWNFFLKAFWWLEEELSIKNLLEQEAVSFNLNMFLETFDEKKTFLFLFAPTVTNFYLADLISSNSKIMGECSLFLGKEGNFIEL